MDFLVAVESPQPACATSQLSDIMSKVMPPQQRHGASWDVMSNAQMSLAPAAAQSGAIIAPETKAKATDPVEFPFRLLSFGAQCEVEDLSA